MLTACGPADPAKTDPLGVLRQNTIEKFEGYGDNAQLKGAFARGFGVGLQSNPGDFAPVTVNTTVDAALADGFYAAQLINQSELPEASDLREQLVSKFESR
ncbi:MAG: hypothetical protein AAF663_04550 [Planctomycetota bacterium]